MVTCIKDILPNLIDTKTNWKFYLLNNWSDIVGSLNTRIRLEKIYQDTLVIGVYESHWLQELFLLSKVLIKSINKRLEGEYISNLKFKLIEENNFTFKAKEINSINYKMPSNFKLTREQELVLSRIEDNILKKELENFLIRCIVRKNI